MPDSWKLKRTKQCAKCPWRKDVNPRNIPNGYSEEKHRALRSTIARPGDLSALTSNKIRVMACHRRTKRIALAGSPINSEPETISLFNWICRSCANADKIRLVGEQHQSFEDTLPSE